MVARERDRRKSVYLTTLPIVHIIQRRWYKMKYEYETLAEWQWQGKREVLEEKPVPGSLCSPQIPRGGTKWYDGCLTVHTYWRLISSFGLFLTSSQHKELKIRLNLLHLSVYPNKLQKSWTNFYEIWHMKNLSKFVDVGTVKLLVRKWCTDCEDSRTGIQDHEDGTGRPTTYSTNVNAARDEEMILKSRKSQFEAWRSPMPQ